jgi:SnoaL-like domain
MSDVAALMAANLLEVFGERDPERRRAAIARTYAPDVVFADEEATTTGQDALEQRVVELQSRLPADASFAPFGPLYAGGGQAALAWTLAPEGGEPIARGLDVATIADGRITALRTLLTG